MKTIEMEIRVMAYMGFRRNLVVPNVSWGMNFPSHGPLHECDILSLTKGGYATEIEIKISKSDLLKDKEKPHLHDHKAIKNLFFAVPEQLVDCALENIPDRAGLLMPPNKKNYPALIVVREASPIRGALKWSESQRHKLAMLGAMRIFGMKKKLWEACK